MKKVITYGTFDTLHFGHLKLLERARNLGDFLIVGLSTDEFNALKGKKSLLNYEERKSYLQAIKYVDFDSFKRIPKKSYYHFKKYLS